MADTIKERDLIRTLVPKDDFPAGSVGVVVELFSPNPACECEIWDEENYPIDTVCYEFSELEVLSEEESKALINRTGTYEDYLAREAADEARHKLHSQPVGRPAPDSKGNRLYEKEGKEKSKNLAKLSNLNYLEYTNRCRYEGPFDLPNTSCNVSYPEIAYLALIGEKRDFKPRDCICFFRYDREFDGKNGLFNAIYYGDRRWLDKFAERYSSVRYFISPDYSIYGDVPLIENAYRSYKARIVSAYLVLKLNKIVIPNISFVDERTKEFALTGIDKGSTVCISTKGLMNGKENIKLLYYIIDETLKEIQPECVILYTATADQKKLEPIVDRIEYAGAHCIVPDNLLLDRNRSKMKNPKKFPWTWSWRG